MNTPRTNTIANFGHINGKRYKVLESDELVPAQFARELETQLGAADHVMRMVCKLLRRKVDSDSLKLNELAQAWLNQYSKSFEKELA